MRKVRILFPLVLMAPLFGFQQDADFKISADVNMVLLDVSVQNSRGAYVAKLPQTAFRVTENGVEQRISSFSNVDVPVEAGLVMDASGSMQSRREEVNLAGVSFVEKSNPNDEIFVVNFNDTVRKGLPASIPFTSATFMRPTSWRASWWPSAWIFTWATRSRWIRAMAGTPPRRPAPTR